MASNNLAAGAKALLEAGADPNFRGGSGETAAAVARASAAGDVLRVLGAHGTKRADVNVQRIVLEGGGSAEVQGEYVATPASKIPTGFAEVCRGQGWDTADTWARLNAGKAWFEAPNGAYIYHNQLDGMWWIDAPSGAGIFKATGPVHAPPAAGYEIIGDHAPVPSIRIFRG